MIMTLLLVVGGLVGLVVAFFVWRIFATIRASHRRTLGVLREIEPVTDALEAGREPARDDILRLAAEPRTRNTLLEALEELDRRDLFPHEYSSAEAIAESDLAFWLCHPNELQQAPDECEFVGTFARTLEPSPHTGHYYLFRFRVKEPHWAAEDGWMAGVAGPYREGESPVPAARGTFSDLTPFESRTPDQHVDTIHQIMVMQGVYADWDEED